MYFTSPACQYLSPATLFGIQLPVVALTVLVIAWEVSGEECVDPPPPPTPGTGPVNAAEQQLLVCHFTNRHFFFFF